MNTAVKIVAFILWEISCRSPCFLLINVVCFITREHGHFTDKVTSSLLQINVQRESND